jgi:hypothetical protein
VDPAYQIANAITSPYDSLGIPTWHYGHEPTTSLATHIGKYFQNSIREDGLLELAKQGIVDAEVSLSPLLYLHLHCLLTAIISIPNTSA